MIPKVIHYTWFSGEKKPPLVQECLASWRKIFHDYEIVEWNSQNCDLDVVDFTRQAAERKRWAFVSDYFRFDLLARHGGIYLDLDMQAIKPFEEMLNDQAFTGFETFKGTLIPVTSALGSIPGHPFAVGARDIFARSQFILENGKQDVTPMGQRLKSFMIDDMGLKMHDSKQILPNGLTVYPSTVLCHQSEQSVVVNHFMASWIPWHKKRKAQVGDVLRKLNLR